MTRYSVELLLSVATVLDSSHFYTLHSALLSHLQVDDKCTPLLRSQSAVVLVLLMVERYEVTMCGVRRCGLSSTRRILCFGATTKLRCVFCKH
jgi:hypothetical protein